MCHDECHYTHFFYKHMANKAHEGFFSIKHIIKHMKAFVEKNKHMIKHIRVLTCNSPLLNKHMKAFFSKKIKHIAHEGFCRKNKHNMCLTRLLPKSSCAYKK